MNSKRKLRRLLEERDRHCQLCGTTQQLTIHHQFGHTAERLRDPRRNQPEFMTILCARCHELYNWAVANFDRRHERYTFEERSATG